MTESSFIYPFHTTIFFKPEETELTTNNLWQPLKAENASFFGVTERRDKICAGQVGSGVFVHSFEVYDNCILCRCTTNRTELINSLVCTEIAIDKTLIDSEKEQLLSLANQFEIDVLVATSGLYSRKAQSVGSGQALYLLGFEARVAAAEASVMALLQLFKDQIVEYVDLPSPAMIPTCVGVDRHTLHCFKELYNTTILIPSISASSGGTIFVSGEVRSLVLMAKRRLETMMTRAREHLLYATISASSTLKLQYVSKFRQRQIAAIMEKHVCFIKVEESVVHFVGTSSYALKMAVKKFTLEVLMPVFEVQYLFHNGASPVSLQYLNSALHKIASEKNIVMLRLDGVPVRFVLVGSSQDVAKAATLIEELRLPGDVQIKYDVELHPDYKDFIAGKKNGKITRIMDNAKCSISLQCRQSADNIFVSLLAESFVDARRGMQLLNDELPAEEAFFIPDAYHRPIIGTRGSIIQTIMRRHNVFIQFSNTARSCQGNIGFIRHDNVVIRCPYKNRRSIPPAKDELKRIVGEYSSLQPRTYVNLTVGQYRYHLRASQTCGLDVIEHIEHKTGAYIMFPTQVPIFNQALEIRGNENSSAEAAEQLIAHLALERQITLHSEISDVPEFINTVVATLKEALDIETTLDGRVIRINYCDIDEKQIQRASGIVEAYIKSKGMQVKSCKTIELGSLVEPYMYPQNILMANPI
ncbi:LADA_0G03180g1_1 [Lachancea dasiensis]|uniref:LADA_0G03180g1_1 n=1 Tax=Lachancea dasiensis TaxID=1072105 RepID=A0A1G4JRJ2_9SACH|nr:LADA_0G03180g1_1 [Lachancea dasiensis]